MLERYNIILASASPRRQQLLKGLDIPFEVRTISNLEETYPAELQGGDIPLYLAKLKANHVQLAVNDLIITADTIVWCDGKALGKPANREQAIEMLRTLADNTHQVFTGVCIKTKEIEVAFVASTDVTFAPLTDEQIEYYLDNYKPYDKAGSYGVQEWIGYVAVKNISGSYYNIMGLPVHQLYNALKEFDK